MEAIHEDSWTRDNFSTELTRALTTLENARMEWNAARLKFTVLSGDSAEQNAAASPLPQAPSAVLGTFSFGQLCRLGFALSWPVAAVVLLVGLAMVALLFRR